MGRAVSYLTSVFGAAAVASVLGAVGHTATAPPSVELAKKCREMAITAHPPAKAGSAKGTAHAEREYFQNCIRKGGKVDQDGTTRQ